jgi:hypothetical protein
MAMTEEPSRPLRFLMVEHVAQELNVGEPPIGVILKTGELRGIQVGGCGAWRIWIADLDAYIEGAHRRTAEKIARGDFFDVQIPAMAMGRHCGSRCAAARLNGVLPASEDQDPVGGTVCYSTLLARECSNGCSNADGIAGIRGFPSAATSPRFSGF